MKLIDRIRIRINHIRFNTGIPPISKARVNQICRQVAKDLEYKPGYMKSFPPGEFQVLETNAAAQAKEGPGPTYAEIVDNMENLKEQMAGYFPFDSVQVPNDEYLGPNIGPYRVVPNRYIPEGFAAFTSEGKITAILDVKKGIITKIKNDNLSFRDIPKIIEESNAKE